MCEHPEQRPQSKFQHFKGLFRKRKKSSNRGPQEEFLKVSQSIEDVCNGAYSQDDGTNYHLSQQHTLGSRAFSHDSIFIPEDSVRTMSQENVSEKVKDLQRQIGQHIQFGPNSPSHRTDFSSDDEAPEGYIEVQAAVEPVGVKGKIHDLENSVTCPSLMKSPRSKPVPAPGGTIESINLDAVPQSVLRLDNTAAKHKLSVKPKNQRVSRQHRRFTKDHEELSIPSVLQEEPESHTNDGSYKLKEEGNPLWWADNLPRNTQEKSKKPKLQEKAGVAESDLIQDEEIEIEDKLWQTEEGDKIHIDEYRIHDVEKKRLKCDIEGKRLQEQDCLQIDEKRKRIDASKKDEIEFKTEQRIATEEIQKRKVEEQMVNEDADRVRIEEERNKKVLKAECQHLSEMMKMKEEETGQWRKMEKLHKDNEQPIKEGEKRYHKKEQIHWWDKRLNQESFQDELKYDPRKTGTEKCKPSVEAEMRLLLDETMDRTDWKQKADEIRWQEMEEKQKPFTFKVSSGEKQIVFQRVHLSPVTPSTDQSSGTYCKEAKVTPTGISNSPSRHSSLFVPHTAILVTGAQLCGAAVNLDQIKDPACKSLLGLVDDRKTVETNQSPIKYSLERKSGKTKSLSESANDESSYAVLAEWANIRSKMFNRVESGNNHDKEIQKQNESRGETFVHSSLRKTMSANAKFSITPAWHKFPNSSRITHPVIKGGENDSSTPDADTSASVFVATGNQTSSDTSVRSLDRTDGCVFAKDLPSFLVPNPYGSHRARTHPEAKSHPDSDSSSDSKDHGAEDKPSLFGIKLRRTNYSLRYRNEQPVEKRKKRYSAGDTFDGIPVPLFPDSESDTSLAKTSPSSPFCDNSDKGPSAGIAMEQDIPKSHITGDDVEKTLTRPYGYKPSVAPKPCSATPSVCPRGRGSSDHVLLTITRNSSNQEKSERRDACQSEESSKEKRSFFPSITIPWRDKGDKRSEITKREKSFLQSRHSLDSGKLPEKEGGATWMDSGRMQEEAGPMWITLALQKQKGFREQQLSREEHRHKREVRLAEKLSREKNEIPVCDSKEQCSESGAAKPKAHDVERAESSQDLMDRREHLRKSNTLPSSVPVENADVVSSAPGGMDQAKRFPATEAQVCSEPAWLALAKRKAKAWSDCPQIINYRQF